VKSKERMESLLREYPENALIFAGRIYEEEFADKMTETAYYQMLSRMCKDGNITRITKGIYYRPKLSKFGAVPPSDHEIIRSFTKDGQGVVVGYALYNALKLTTQVPKRILVYSSLPDEQHRRIGNVVLQRCSLKFDSQVCSTVRMLDVLQHYGEIQELEHERFAELCAEFSEAYCDSTVHEVLSNIRYSKRTVAFLREVLEYHGRKHTLDRYLSSLSDYKIPRMEALYESARKPS